MASRVTSHKTDAVMKLLTGGKPAVNPMVDQDFKESVIEKKRTEPKAVKPTEICISSELITEILPVALKRFNCCCCDRCFASAMADALDCVPYITVNVNNDEDMKRAKELKKRSRRDVMRSIIRLVISRRGLERHDIK